MKYEIFVGAKRLQGGFDTPGDAEMHWRAVAPAMNKNLGEVTLRRGENVVWVLHTPIEDFNF